MHTLVYEHMYVCEPYLKVTERYSLLISVVLHSHQCVLVVGVVASVVVVAGAVVSPVAAGQGRTEVRRLAC